MYQVDPPAQPKWWIPSTTAADFMPAHLGGGKKPTLLPVEGTAHTGDWFSLGATLEGKLATAHYAETNNGYKAPSYLWVDPANRNLAPLALPRGFSSSAEQVTALAVNQSGTLEALVVSGDQARAVVAPPPPAGKGRLEVLDVPTGKVTLPGSSMPTPASLAFAPAGPWLAVVSGGRLSVLDALGPNAAGPGTSDPYRLTRTGTGVQAVSWSARIAGSGFEDVVPVAQNVGGLFSQASAAMASGRK